ncbi:MAG: undecaprenyl-phosphate galactose phosphotransferase WbaP [Spirochaetaceae bacterium]|nr:undecaprenyl-phosphate galactose phosphotransferase WbaP [Spirochaetaceae bacterium]
MQAKDFYDWFKKRYKHTSSFSAGFALLIVDFLVIMLSIGTSFFIINLINRSFINFRSFVNYWIYLPFFFLVFYSAKLYPGIVLSPADEVRRFSICSLFCFAGIALSVIVETDDKVAVTIALFLSIPFASLALPIGRQLARGIFSNFKFWGVPSVIYIQNLENTIVIDRLIKHPDLGYSPALILCNDRSISGTNYHGIPILEPNDEIYSQIKKLNIKTIIIIENKDSSEQETEIMSAFMKIFRYTIFIPHNPYIRSISSSVRDFSGILGFSTTHRLTKRSELFIKRCIDLFLLLIASIPTLILTAVIAICIKIDSPGPIFYGHKRIGKNGKLITVYKFRSMVTNSQEILEKILKEDPIRREEWERERKFKDDPRITKFGKFLRNSSLDELPQLLNILKGDMSFIGPRPVTDSELIKYGKNVDYILSVKPGLSGMWQVSGRSDTGYEERIMLDTYYIQNWSIWLDIWIIVKTIWVVIRGKGAY